MKSIIIHNVKYISGAEILMVSVSRYSTAIKQAEMFFSYPGKPHRPSDDEGRENTGAVFLTHPKLGKELLFLKTNSILHL